MIFLSSLYLALSGLLPSPQAELVEAPTGPIQGVVDDAGIRSFLGIPFAQAPVGELRWAPARALEDWDQVFVADAYSDAASQPEPRSYQNIGARSEDSQYLNVYAPPAEPDSAAKAPVLVWFHGGGFVGGTAMSSNYDGHALAAEGLVVVAPNYRLGPFGFLPHPALVEESGSTGNQAISDWKLALEWVQRNVSAFGGDPDNVTIAGQSSGGSAVTALMSSLQTRDLFQRAIVHSGGAAHGLRSLDFGEPSAFDWSLAFARRLGVEEQGAEGLAALRAVPPEAILTAWRENTAELGRLDLVIDGTFLTESPAVTFREGRQAPVPVIVGATKDESSMFMLRNRVADLTGFDTWLEERFGEEAQAAARIYPAQTVDEAHLQQVRFGNDAYSTYAREVARAAAAKAPTWRYRFERVSPFGEQLRMGSFHGADIAYLFGGVSEGQRYTADDVRLAEQLRGYWVSFCENGDPNGADRPHWPAYESSEQRFLIFDSELGTDQAWRNDACDLIESVWSRP